MENNILLIITLSTCIEFIIKIIITILKYRERSQHHIPLLETVCGTIPYILAFLNCVYLITLFKDAGIFSISIFIINTLRIIYISINLYCTRK